MLNKTGGVFAGSGVNESDDLGIAIDGFFDSKGQSVNSSNYSKATQYAIAAAIGDPYYDLTWNGNDGLVAEITFQITSQPSKALNQSDFYTQLHISYAEMGDTNMHEVPYTIIQGTLRIDAAGPP
jgi:hypothetical protein